MKLTHPTEADVQRQCLDYLHLLGAVAVRVNSGAMRVGKRLVRFNSVDGCSDVIASIPHPTRGAVPAAIECKKPGWKPARPDAKDRERVEREAAQRAFLDRWCKSGGLGIFVRSLDDLRAALAAEGFDVA